MKVIDTLGCSFNRLIKISTLIGAFCLISACSYEPTETNFVDIDTTTVIPNLTLDLGDATDTLFVCGSAYLNYHIGLAGRKLYQAQVILSGAGVIKTITDTVGTFLFDTGKYADGTYTMIIDLYVSTNSGSLADVSKVEAVHAWRELKVVIDNSAPSQVQIQTTSPFSGGLTITWQKYPKRNFAKYVLL